MSVYLSLCPVSPGLHLRLQILVTDDDCSVPGLIDKEDLVLDILFGNNLFISCLDLLLQMFIDLILLSLV